jgi:acyl-CoA thioester hydrolase
MPRKETCQVRVRYADTDQMGVVYHANYLHFFEIGRAEWLRAQGRSYREMEDMGHLLPVIETHVRYRAPARYDDLLEVVATPDELRAASVRFVYEVRRAGDGALLAEGWTRHACMRRDGRPVRWPAEIEAILRGE